MKLANVAAATSGSVNVRMTQTPSHRTLFAVKQKPKGKSFNSSSSVGSCTLETKTRTTVSSNSSHSSNLSGSSSSSSSEIIRNRLLRRLGIYPSSVNAGTNASDTMKTPEFLLKERAQTSLLKDTATFSVPLKYKEYPKEVNYTRTTSIHYAYHSSAAIKRTKNTRNKKVHNDIPSKKNQTDQQEKTNRRKIGFSSTVSVLPIPKHDDYSDRVKTRLWSNRHEIQNNAQRNYIEFAAEGWDWRTVTEESNMFLCTASGDLIHPVHCRPIYQNWQIHQQRQHQLEQHLQQQHLHNHTTPTSQYV